MRKTVGSVLALLVMTGIGCASTVASEPLAPTPSPLAPTPAATVGPAPTAAPSAINPVGPYVLFEGEDGIWIANPDGTFLTRLSDSGVGPADLHRAVSPQGDALAHIAPTEHGPTLTRIELPGGATQVLATLQNVIPSDVPIESLTPEAFAYFVITQSDNVAWEPGEGGRLAFIGAMDGPTADLYLYDFASGSISRLTDGASQAFYPSWSPDGEYVVHFGGSFIEPFGGAIIGPTRADGAWAVRVADGGVIRQPETVSYPHNLVGWQADGRYLHSADGDECSQKDFVAVDPDTAAGTAVLEACSTASALSPDGALLFGSSVCGDCPWGEGAFLLSPGATDPIQVWDEQAWEVNWLEEGSLFFAYPLGLVSADGSVRVERPGDNYYEPAVSTTGRVAWKAVDPSASVIEIARPGEAPVVVDLHPEAMIWDPRGDEILLVAADDGGLYALSAPDFVPRRVGTFDGRPDEAIWVR